MLKQLTAVEKYAALRELGWLTITYGSSLSDGPLAFYAYLCPPDSPSATQHRFCPHVRASAVDSEKIMEVVWDYVTKGVHKVDMAYARELPYYYRLSYSGEYKPYWCVSFVEKPEPKAEPAKNDNPARGTTYG